MTRIYNDVYEADGETFRLPTDLTGELGERGRRFEGMRYYYEGGDFARHWFLSPLPDLLRRFILIEPPEWGEGSALVEGSYNLKKDEVNWDLRPIGNWGFIMYGIPQMVTGPRWRHGGRRERR